MNREIDPDPDANLLGRLAAASARINALPDDPFLTLDLQALLIEWDAILAAFVRIGEANRARWERA